MQIKQIATIKTDFNEKFGIPRQSGIEELKGKIIFEKEYRDFDVVRGLENFSHLWLIFDFSENHREKHSHTVRPPRLGGNTRIGVFATRSPFRPNNLGLSCVKLEKIEKTDNLGPVLHVSGVDILNGTPIYDIKPYIPYSDLKIDAVGSYAEENKDYKIEVVYKDKIFKNFPKDKINALLKILEQDPRPSYQNDERIYNMNFSGFEISFNVQNNKLNILNIK